MGEGQVVPGSTEPAEEFAPVAATGPARSPPGSDRKRVVQGSGTRCAPPVSLRAVPVTDVTRET